MFVYIITNTINGKSYIGISNDPERRWKQHCARTNQSVIARAIRKYEVEKFTFSVVFEGDEQAAKDLEIHLIAHYGTIIPRGYNITAGGEGMLGYHPSDETRKKMSQWQQGRTLPEETCEKIRQTNSGKKASEETRKKMSQSRKGRKHSKETRDKIGQGNKGKKYSEETRKK